MLFKKFSLELYPVITKYDFDHGRKETKIMVYRTHLWTMYRDFVSALAPVWKSAERKT